MDPLAPKLPRLASRNGFRACNKGHIQSPRPDRHEVLAPTASANVDHDARMPLCVGFDELTQETTRQ
jgi:hypothetical protein